MKVKDKDINQQDVFQYVMGLIQRAKKAQRIAEDYTQEYVDKLATAIAWDTAGNDSVVAELAELALKETRLGDYNSKVAKIKKKVRGVLRDIKHEKTVGVIDENKEKGLIKIAKPAGVIGALVPSTQPEMSPILQALCSIKARDAIIFAPHPRGKKTTFRTAEIMRTTLKKYGAPEDLIICTENPTVQMSQEIMKQCDLIMATGGQPMVKAAYSSGTPAYGVGAGNANIVVDETAEIKEAAHKIMLSKTFDLSAGCSCDNSLIIQELIYEEMIDALNSEGGYLVTTAEEKEQLKKAIWPNWPADYIINRDIVASSVENIANIAGLSIGKDRKFILVEESGSGADYPFSGEKMCLVVAVYKYKKFADAIRIVNENLAYSGAGHSCGIYSKSKENIIQFALQTQTVRVVVNQPQSYTNTGDWTCGMPFTGALGCGTWGGNIASENIVLKHYLNITWVTSPISSSIPTDEELFGDLKKR
jgi:sulfoacetaldehyde dehydrogenase